MWHKSSRSEPTDQHCRKGSPLARIKIIEKILASFVRPINADGEKPAWYLRDRKPPHRLAALFRAPPGSCRRHPVGTHRCAGGCALRAAARSRGSSSAPTRTGTCTPPSRSARPPPRCWSMSGTPAWESVGEILSTSAFIHENRARRVAVLSLVTQPGLEPIRSGNSGSLEKQYFPFAKQNGFT